MPPDEPVSAEEIAEAEAEIQYLAGMIGAQVQRFGLVNVLRATQRSTQLLGQSLAQFEVAGGRAADLPAWSGLDDAEFLRGAAIDLDGFVSELESGDEYEDDDE